jgi:putative transposase
MTYHADCTLPEELLDQIAEGGLAALPDALRLLLNAAMLLERQKFIGAGPYERSADRQAHANGFTQRVPGQDPPDTPRDAHRCRPAGP